MRPVRKDMSSEDKQMEYFIEGFRMVVREEIARAFDKIAKEEGGESVKKSMPNGRNDLVESFM